LPGLRGLVLVDGAYLTPRLLGDADVTERQALAAQARARAAALYETAAPMEREARGFGQMFFEPAFDAMRDRMIEAIVEEWPVGCPPDRVEEVVTARMKIRLREQYGSIVAMFLLSILVNALVKLIVEWWFDRESHRVLMVGWASRR